LCDQNRGGSTTDSRIAGPGLHLIQELRTNPEAGVPAPIGINPEGDKLMRMEAQSARFEAGQVYLLKQAPWLATLLHELSGFPKGRTSGRFHFAISQLGGNCPPPRIKRTGIHTLVE
jgi:hypothetical protein